MNEEPPSRFLGIWSFIDPTIYDLRSLMFIGRDVRREGCRLFDLGDGTLQRNSAIIAEHIFGLAPASCKTVNNGRLRSHSEILWSNFAADETHHGSPSAKSFVSSLKEAQAKAAKHTVWDRKPTSISQSWTIQSSLVALVNLHSSWRPLLKSHFLGPSLIRPPLRRTFKYLDSHIIHCQRNLQERPCQTSEISPARWYPWGPRSE